MQLQVQHEIENQFVKRHEQWTKLDNEVKESQTRAHELVLRVQYG